MTASSIYFESYNDRESRCLDRDMLCLYALCLKEKLDALSDISALPVCSMPE